ncbi:hypothetical protein L7F22_037456 [Adiantum nelumboides]|nr:hypothetical protein [Adiantum nelumboides]
MLAFVLKFATLSIQSPIILCRDVLGYEQLPSFQVACSLVPFARNISLLVEDSGFESLLAQVKSLDFSVKALQEMLLTYGLYKGSDAGALLDQVTSAVAEDTTSVKAMLQAYKDDAVKEVVIRPAKFKSLTYASRVQFAHWKQHNTTYLGGMGGSSHEYVSSMSEFMSAHQRVAAIAMRREGIIDRIRIYYDNGDKFVKGWAGGQASSVLYLQDDGVHLKEICIQANLWGEHRHIYISSLKFTLTDGNHHYFCGFKIKAGKYVYVRPK